MYQTFFQLSSRPFLAAPLASWYFPAASIEYARQTVSRCVDRAEGPAIVVGPAGTGKSMLCHVLSEQFKQQFPVALLASARLCTRRALLQNILFELELPYRDREEGELRLSLIDYLKPRPECPDGILLVVDEAHMLPLRLLEELHMITNLVRDGRPRVRLVLIGNLAFDERLADPHLESLNQRIAARCYLQAMSRDETGAYVHAQLTAAGGRSGRILADDAWHAVFQATDGIPRLVNQVCDHALLLACTREQPTINAALIEAAWADLQQLPVPSIQDDRPAKGDAPEILEFGELDDELGEFDSEPVLTADPPVENPPTQVAELTDDDTTLDLDDEPDRAMQNVPSTPVLHDPQPADAADAGGVGQQPADACEIELIFHQAKNPFDESFEEEELIVDPLASLESLNVPHTSLAQTHDSPNDLRDVAADEQTMIAGRMPAIGQPQALSPGDDRDLLEIVDETDSAVNMMIEHADSGERVGSYRQLFTSLRRRSIS